MKRRTFVHLTGAAAAPPWAAQADSQPPPWPTRIIRLIVPFGAGSGNDIVATLIAEPLARALGRSVVVDNRVGANGSIGADAAARAAPDGYTLFMGTNTTQAANPALMKKLNYDPIQNFAPISRIANTPALLVVRPGLPAKTLTELIALAKAQPGRLTYASGSAGTIVPAAMLTRQTGTFMLHIPYKTIPQGLNDVVAGQVDMMFTDMATGIPQVKGGKVRALAVSSLQPVAALPSVPPMATTLPGFELVAWYALYAPAGTPQAVIQRVHQEVVRIVDSPAIRNRLTHLGLQPVTSTPAELESFGRSELTRWAEQIRQAGIEPE